MKPPGALESNADDQQKKEGRRQAKNEMARHGREPLGADRGRVDACHDVNRKTFELAKSDPPLGSVELRVRDRIDDPFPTLRDGLVQAAAGLEAALAVRRPRIAREKLPVRANERVQVSGAAADERVEFLEVLRQDGDRCDAVEGTIDQRATPGKNEKWRAEARQPRRGHVADVSPRVAGHVHAEEAAIARIEVRRRLRELAGKQRLAVAIDEEDGTQLRQGTDDLLETIVQARLVVSDGLVGHAAHDLVDLGDGALDRLEHLERVLVQNIERALDALIGDGIFVVIIQPGRPCEQRGGEHHRRDHHQLEHANCRLTRRAHGASFHGCAQATIIIYAMGCLYLRHGCLLSSRKNDKISSCAHASPFVLS